MTGAFGWGVAAPFVEAIGFSAIACVNAWRYRAATSPTVRGQQLFMAVAWMLVGPLQCWLQCTRLAQHGAVVAAWVAGAIASAIFAIAITLVVAERRGARVP